MSWYKLKLSGLSLAMLIGLGKSALVARAQVISPTLAGYHSNLVDVSFVPPQDEGAPRHTASGASRSNCPQPMALLPAGHAYGLTTQERPVIWVHLPQSSAQQIFLSIKTAGGDYYYGTQIDIVNRTGITAIALPEEAPPLTLGEPYQWSIALICRGGLRPDSPFVQGWIRPVQLDSHLTTAWDNLLPIEKAAFYGQQGIWYDMVSVLAYARVTNPDDNEIEQAWNSVLDAANLGQLTEAESSL
ncbi:MAG: DUF928 domain-containing protein [Cyanobacteria bacterium P01_G01_bin.38]